MIPAVLHQIWIGPRPVPLDWVEPWPAMHPGWEHRLWRDEDIDRLSLVNRKAYDWYAERGMWFGAASVARVEILLRDGGVYVDIDARPLQPFTGALFLEGDVFAAYEPNVPDLPGRVANGTIGAEAGSHVLTTYRELIRRLRTLEPSWDTVGGTAFTAALLLHRRCCDLRILPARVLYPIDARGRITPGLEDAYCDHFWASTNSLYRDEAAA